MPRKDRTVGIGVVVASRVITLRNSRAQKITISIGRPRRSLPSSWQCSYLIKGMGAPIIGRAGGVDALQALLMAIEGVRVTLERTGHRFVWLDPENGLGIPFLVPLVHGKSVEDRVREVIDQARAEFEKKAINDKTNTVKSSKRAANRQKGST